MKSGSLASAVRAGEWWDYKLAPLLTAFYATMLLLERPIARSWDALLFFLLAIAAGAAFVSLLNDFTDLDEDRAAGKPNRMEGRATAFRAIALLLPPALGLGFVVLWRDSAWLVGAYLAAWVAFGLYSLPPFRLKTRGFAGVLADASGAHLFPTLVAMLVAFRAAGATLEPVWLAAGGTWALGYGLRGILWHQLADLEHDRTAGVRTFAARRGAMITETIGRWAAFPLELAGLGALIVMLGEPLPPLLLLAYLALVALRVRLWRMSAVIVRPRPRYLILLHEYYDVWLPLALLAAAVLRHPIDLAIFASHLILFGARPAQSARDVRDLLLRPAWRRLQNK